MTDWRKPLVAVLLVGTAILAGGTVHAQGLPGSGPIPVITVPGSVVSDQLAEQYLADIDQNMLPMILNQETLTATSLTTASPGAVYAPNAQYIASLDQALTTNDISSANANQILPVTMPLNCDSYDDMINYIAPAVANTYYAALGDVTQQENELQGEDFTTISNNIQTPYELTATQGAGQAALANAQESQLLRHSIDTLITVMATAELQKLDMITRSKMDRSSSADCAGGPAGFGQVSQIPIGGTP